MFFISCFVLKNFPQKNDNCKNAVPPVLLLYDDTPGVVLEEEQPGIAKVPPDVIDSKQTNIRTIN